MSPVLYNLYMLPASFDWAFGIKHFPFFFYSAWTLIRQRSEVDTHEQIASFVSLCVMKVFFPISPRILLFLF